MNTIVIPWLKSCYRHGDFLKNYGIFKKDVKIRWFEFADKAISELQTQEYPLIIIGLNPLIFDVKTYPSLTQTFSSNRLHIKGLETIKLIRSNGVNIETPIWATEVDYTTQKSSGYSKTLEKTCLEFGATEYICLLKYTPSKFTEKIQKFLNKS